MQLNFHIGEQQVWKYLKKQIYQSHALSWKQYQQNGQ